MNIPSFNFYLQDESGNYLYATLQPNGTWIISTTTTPTPLKYAPKNWQDVEIKWTRNETYWGLYRSSSHDFQFVEDGAAILRYLFYNNWIQAKPTFTIQYQIDAPTSNGANDGLRYATLYQSEIDLSSMLDEPTIPQGNNVTVQTLDSRTYSLLRAFGDTEYNVNFGKIARANNTANITSTSATTPIVTYTNGNVLQNYDVSICLVITVISPTCSIVVNCSYYDASNTYTTINLISSLNTTGTFNSLINTITAYPNTAINIYSVTTGTGSITAVSNGTIDGGYVPANLSWIAFNGIALYANWNFATAVDPTTSANLSFDMSSGNVNNAIIPLNEYKSPNTPIGNDINQAFLKTNIQIPIPAGTDGNKPWGRFGGDGAFTSNNYFFKSISPIAAFDAYAQITTNISILVETFLFDGTTYEDFTFSLYEVDTTINNANQITIGINNKNTVTGRVPIFTIRYWGKNPNFFPIDKICDGTDGNPVVTIGQDAPFTRYNGGNKWYELIYENAGSYPNDKGALFKINPNKVYVLTCSVLRSDNTFRYWNDGAGSTCFFTVGTTTLGWNMTLQPKFNTPVTYPPSPCSFLRLSEVWQGIYDNSGKLIAGGLPTLMANTQGNYGYPNATPLAFNIKLTGKSMFLSDTTKGWNENYYNKPAETAIISGTALRLFQNTAAVSLINGNNATQTGILGKYAITLRNGTETVTLPLYGTFFDQYAPYTTIQGAFATMSVNSFFKALDAVYMMGMGIELDNDGNPTILRLENRGYFFNNSVLIDDLGKVVSLKIEPYHKISGNTLKIGYQNENYNQDYGTDEARKQLQFKLPIDRVLNQVDWTSQFRADPYGIEFSRADTSTNAQTQFNADNDIWFVEFDGSTLASSYSFAIGNTSYSKNNVYQVKSWVGSELVYWGLFFPNTTEFNMGLTPKRNMLRHGSWLRAMCYKQDTANITFQSFSIPSTIGLKVDLDGSGNPNSLVDEFADVPVSTLDAPMFLPYTVEFDCPSPVDLFNQMNTNPNGYYQFEYKGATFKMFPLECGINAGSNKTFHFKGLLTPDTDLNTLIYLANDISMQ